MTYLFIGLNVDDLQMNMNEYKYYISVVMYLNLLKCCLG